MTRITRLAGGKWRGREEENGEGGRRRERERRGEVPSPF